MNTRFTTTLALGLILFGGFVSSVSAETATTTSKTMDVRRESIESSKRDVRTRVTSTSTPIVDMKRLASAKEKANREIDRRIENLNTLIRRVNGMERLSASQRQSLASIIQAEITALTSLKAQIMGATNVETLRGYLEMVKKTHRIYALVMPQVQILAAGERVLRLSTEMGKFSVKLDARIQEGKALGSDVSRLESTLVDFKKKLAGAEEKARAAMEAVLLLKSDGGDELKHKANQAALKEARGNIKAAESELRSARKSAEGILKGIRGNKEKKSDVATTTPGN